MAPVQTRMPIAVGRESVGVRGGDCQGLKSLVGRQHSCKRRVFVQTDSGSVLGIELERADNAQTVKKIMQTALHVPTEQSALTFGDMILKNDLSNLRNDAPLRLERSIFHRSSSTPCISSALEGSPKRDKSGPLEILGGLRSCNTIKKLIKQAIKGIKKGVDPVPAKGGLGGAYFFRNVRGESIAIVKPTDEEPLAPNNPKGCVGKRLGQPGFKRSVRVGETGIREVAAYLLDHGHFAKVPPTVLVKVSHSIFNVNTELMMTGRAPNANNEAVSKIASFQQFVSHDFDASDHGTSSFSVSAVHRIGILDVRILNTDRHGGNILVKTTEKDFSKYAQVGDTLDLIPIDHGLCLPEILDDPYFEWQHWPQASIPFSEEEMDYIDKLDAYKDADLLRGQLPMLRVSSLRVLILCTVFLKIAAKAGLCLADIGQMMGRENSGDDVSELELICIEAKVLVDQEISPRSDLAQSISDSVSEKEHWTEQFELDDVEFEEGLQRDNTRNVYDWDGSVNPSKEVSDYYFLPSEYGYSARSSNGSIASCHLSSPKLLSSSRMPFCIDCPSPRTPRGLQLSKLEEFPALEGEDVEESLEEPDIIHQQSLSAQFMHSARITNSSSSSSGQVKWNSSNAATWKWLSSMEAVTCSRPTQSGHELSIVASKGISFADMSDPEWVLFMKHFQELLSVAIASREKRASAQRHRLGTSCQF